MKIYNEENHLIGYDKEGRAVYIPLFTQCESCEGTGKKEHAPETCPICAIRKSTDPSCNVCHGTGRAPARQVDCRDCHGAGRIVVRHNAELIRDALEAIGSPGTPTGLNRIDG